MTACWSLSGEDPRWSRGWFWWQVAPLKSSLTVCHSVWSSGQTSERQKRRGHTEQKSSSPQPPTPPPPPPLPQPLQPTRSKAEPKVFPYLRHLQPREREREPRAVQLRGRLTPTDGEHDDEFEIREQKRKRTRSHYYCCYACDRPCPVSSHFVVVSRQPMDQRRQRRRS